MNIKYYSANLVGYSNLFQQTVCNKKHPKLNLNRNRLNPFPLWEQLSISLRPYFQRKEVCP